MLSLLVLIRVYGLEIQSFMFVHIFDRLCKLLPSNLLSG
jgi:hypothetical protein